jgi:hypothetical protein
VSYLIYCIFGGTRGPIHPLPPGVGGEPVFVVTQKGLSAALSQLVESDLAPHILQIVDYERVVEAFFRSTTVIPLRYGCRVADASEAARLLEKRRDEYETVLRKLAGVGEMGIHILPNGSRPEKDLRPPPPATPSKMSGAAYLEARRQYLLSLDQAALDQRGLAEDLCSFLVGLYVRRKVEVPESSSRRPLSIYFLVPQDRIDSFRQAARQLLSRHSLKMLLSGPWPPYNFVDRDDTPCN